MTHWEQHIPICLNIWVPPPPWTIVITLTNQSQTTYTCYFRKKLGCFFTTQNCCFYVCMLYVHCTLYILLWIVHWLLQNPTYYIVQAICEMKFHTWIQFVHCKFLGCTNKFWFQTKMYWSVIILYVMHTPSTHKHDLVLSIFEVQKFASRLICFFLIHSGLILNCLQSCTAYTIILFCASLYFICSICSKMCPFYLHRPLHKSALLGFVTDLLYLWMLSLTYCKNRNFCEFLFFCKFQKIES